MCTFNVNCHLESAQSIVGTRGPSRRNTAFIDCPNRSSLVRVPLCRFPLVSASFFDFLCESSEWRIFFLSTSATWCTRGGSGLFVMSLRALTMCALPIDTDARHACLLYFRAFACACVCERCALFGSFCSACAPVQAHVVVAGVKMRTLHSHTLIHAFVTE